MQNSTDVIPVQSLRIIEFSLALFALIAAFTAPTLGATFFNRVERWGGRLASRQSLAILLVGLAAPAIRLAILPLRPIPQPAVHDEFSHLLAADTFASGRLTNPTHPMWEHFETFHVDQQPTYMSMYPPGQGLVLAAGKTVFGQPWFGVCFAMGLMCAAVCWMLYGWLPPGWAFLGGVLVLFRIGISSYWMDSYWGGGLPALGGALVLGALPRLMLRPQPQMALVLGFGLVLLANTRPYEGVLLGAPVSAALLVWIIRKRAQLAFLTPRVIVPLTIVLLVGAAAMLYYNSRVFGRPLALPYQINRATYAISPVFIWQTPGPAPFYRHDIMRKFYTEWELPVFENARTLTGFFQGAAIKAGLALVFFFGPLLTLGLVMLPRVLRDPLWRIIWISAAVFIAGLLVNAFSVPHYFAPVTALIYAVLLESMRHLRLWRYQDQPVGLSLVRTLPLLCGVMLVLQVGSYALTRPKDLPRTAVQHRLENMPGDQVAIVRYGPGHDPMGEWVYNAANIDGAKVVWAHDMGPTANQQLLSYFKGRKVWLIQPDSDPIGVSPYVP